MLKLKTGLALSFAFLVSVPFGALAQNTDNVVLQMEEFTCRDMLVRSGFERDFTIAYMHGYMSGKLSEITFDTNKLTLATDAVLDYCISKPDASLLAAFEEARG
ncbi:HdeA/HdeB family chaperone [Ruegeria marina]|uniref:HdeA/HdeB family protein n=1 Tax=Ruegeria marina TaxID=639004 RepID=A0A1G7F7D9_9RHOB|nr:HdeA/HdeB family chaperone [Ruegeria marina]SDE71792.1 HdeA/HdeB family protein [Ruegeria marina]